MEKLRFEGKKEETLLNSALESLGLTENDIFYNMHEEKVGILKSKKYILEVVKVEEVAALGKETLLKLLEGLGIEGKVEQKIREKSISYSIFSDNNSILIGKRGHILEAIQVFVRQAIFNKLGLYVNLLVDVENYKQKQNYFLEKNVKRIAKEVQTSKIAVKLDPMNSYERKLVHDALTNFKNIESTSEGEEPNRCVVIKYVSKKSND